MCSSTNLHSDHGYLKNNVIRREWKRDRNYAIARELKHVIFKGHIAIRWSNYLYVPGVTISRHVSRLVR